MQHQFEALNKHIVFLKSLDTEEFYEKDEDEVRKYADEAITALIQLGDSAIKELTDLLKTEFTWSSYFALKILREIKNPESIPVLIEFLRKESDDSLANEEAMFALQDLGDPSIVPLLEELEDEFAHKRYNFYMVGAFTGIISPTTYDFMVTITQDFLKNPAKYRGWFHVDDFTYNFVKQERKEVASLLKQILEVRSLTGDERQEIRDTIHVLENPDQYHQEIQDTINDLSSSS